MSQVTDTQTVRSEITAAMKRKYLPGYSDVRNAFREHVINELIGSIHSTHGYGLDIKFKTKYKDSARMSNDMFSPYPAGMEYTFQEITARYNDRTVASNDFRKVSARAQITEMDLVRASEKSEGGDASAVIELAKMHSVDILEDIDQNLAVKRHCPIKGHLCRVVGVLKDNDGETYADSNTFSSPETSVRFQIDRGSLQRIWPGRELDVYNSAETAFIRGRVTDVNPEDDSVGMDVTVPDTGATSSSYTDGYVYLSHEKGKGGYHGLHAWSEAGAANFIGGVDRSSKDYRWMNMIRVDASSATINKALLDRAFERRQLTKEGKKMGLDLIGHARRVNELRNAVGEDSLVMAPTNPTADLQMGHETIAYRHPLYGMIRFREDNMCDTTRVYCVDRSEVHSLRYGPKAPYLPDEMYRPTSDTSGAQGRGMVWFTDALLMGSLDFILDPKSAFVIHTLADN